MLKFKAGIFFLLFTFIFADPVSLMADFTDAAGSKTNCASFDPQNHSDILLLVRECYVDEIDESALGAAYEKGGLAEVFGLLDPHSRYFDEESKVRMDALENEEKSFGGIGLELFLSKKGIVVVGIIAGSPASHGNIMEGDIISAVCGNGDNCIVVDGKVLDSANRKDRARLLYYVVSKIRGKIGTSVILKLKRKGLGGDVAVEVKRGIIKVENVVHRSYGEFGYIRLYQFSDGADRRIEDAISKLPANTKGLVLDLRGNPGGLLPQANRISALFLDRKNLIETIVTRENSRVRPQKFYAAYFRSVFKTNFKMPLVVLVNYDSASASEIVAAAIQDNKRGVVIGSPNTFGKALVQSVYNFGNERVIITTGRIYRPNGRSLQGKGVIPDIVVSNAEGGAIEDEIKEYRDDSERGLERYLKGEEEEFTDEEKEKFSLIVRDRQLEMALEVLKILNLNMKK